MSDISEGPGEESCYHSQHQWGALLLRHSFPKKPAMAQPRLAASARAELQSWARIATLHLVVLTGMPELRAHQPLEAEVASREGYSRESPCFGGGWNQV